MEKLAQLFQDVVQLWDKYHVMYLNGIKNTLILALVATVIGCLIGLVCGVLNTIPYTKNDPWPKRFLLKLLRVLIRIYVEVFRGTPMVLQAVFVYYGLPYFTDNAVKFTSMWTAAILIVSINTGAYMAESVRGGIISIDPGQTEGAKAIGMTHVQTMTSVIMPQALRNIMPQIGNNYINNMYFPSAAIEMVGYLTMTLLASLLLRWVEKRMDGSDSYDLVQTDALTMSAGTYNHPSKGTPFDERSKEYRGDAWEEKGER